MTPRSNNDVRARDQALRDIGLLQLLDDFQGSRHVLVGGQFVVGGGEGGDDLVVLADHVGHALDEAVVDVNAADVLNGALGGVDAQVVGRGDFSVGVGGHGELAGAVVRIRGELVEAGDAVGRYADDGGSSCVELRFVFSESVGFQIATLGVGGGVEVHHHGAFL